MTASVPDEAPDRAAEVVLELLVRAHEAILAGEEHDLEPLRFEAYRQASVSWNDLWRVARVADVEELAAEAAAQRGDLHAARLAWRGAWWIRRLLGNDEDGARSDEVMAALDRLAGHHRGS